MIENVKKLKEERQIEELKKLQIEAGLIPASHMQRLDWIYQGPECNKDITTAEEVLIGKSLKDEKPEEKRYFTPVFQESYSNPQNENFTRIHEDPLFSMKKEHLKKRKEFEENPYKMKMLLKKIEDEVLDKMNSNGNEKKEKKEKKSKKNKKHKKEKKRKRSYSSRSSSRDSVEDRYRKSSSKHKNKEKDEYKLALNEESKSSSKNKTQLETKKGDYSKNNFGLLDNKGNKLKSERKSESKNLGPDESLYKNRMDIIRREDELRKKRSKLLIVLKI